MKLNEDNYLAHYGILRKSGRYPWGSGKNPVQRSKTFLDVIDQHRKDGMADKDIAKLYSRDDAPFTLNDLREYRTIARNRMQQDQINQIVALREKGLSDSAIGRKMGMNESSVRSRMKASVQEKLDIHKRTVEMLRRQVEEKGTIDIGTQVERSLPLGENPAARIGISNNKFKTAVKELELEGYVVHKVPVKQLGTGLDTTVLVLAKKDVLWKDLVNDPARIKLITEHSDDGGRGWISVRPPTNVSSKRIKINYAEDGGATKDGLIELRPGAKDLDLGKANYAQVRIAVDGTHYLKGMAVYNADLPVGTDIRFNTNKPKKGNTKQDVMKPMEKDKETGKVDLENPFGAYIKRQNGALNIVNEEKDWEGWKKNLPAQMLSKQHPDLVRSQLDLTYDRRRGELDEIKALTNPTIKKKLLETFGDETDSSAVHLEAVGMRRQASKVLIPVNSVKPDQIYCPSLENGERVALVRFPHGGTFEIPQLTVNNKNPEARRLLGSSAEDAVGIHHKVAERLSGADFDGDAVIVIPNKRGDVKSTPALADLKDFDPRSSFPPYDGMRTIDGGKWNAEKKERVFPKGKDPNSQMQNEMGNISNLITDMTVRGATTEELAAAVRHSMVVIDAEKHSLDYKASKERNGIPNLKRKYQFEPTGGATTGASTLLSRATAEARIPKRKARPAKDGGAIDPATGKKVFVETGESYVKDGKTIIKTFETKRLAIEDDAHTLSTGTTPERLYADHSNKLKALANESRKEMVATPNLKRDPSSARVYSKEVDSLNAKLDEALRNAPRERQAQAVGRSIVNQKKAANPNLSKEDEKKITRQALAESRFRTGASKTRIGSEDAPLTQREWEAIQAGAISESKMRDILNNANLDAIRRFAQPRQHTLMTSVKTARAQRMLAAGFTQAEVAKQLGVGLSTLKLSLAE